MENVAKLIFEGKEYDFPIVVGTEGEKAVNIEKLRALTGLITLDSGYKNTGSCKSAITFLDGEKGSYAIVGTISRISQPRQSSWR